jgi:hypothetical protein
MAQKEYTVYYILYVASMCSKVHELWHTYGCLHAYRQVTCHSLLCTQTYKVCPCDGSFDWPLNAPCAFLERETTVSLATLHVADMGLIPGNSKTESTLCPIQPLFENVVASAALILVAQTRWSVRCSHKQGCMPCEHKSNLSACGLWPSAEATT